VLKQTLDVRFDIRLLKAITMLLALDVLALHVFAFEALVLPVEFEVDVASDRCNR